MEDNNLPQFLHKTFSSVIHTDKYENDAIEFSNQFETYILSHIQNCCESVVVDDINGDLSDLVNSPILSAYESSSYVTNLDSDSDNDDESYTWTFYHFSTIKGSVVIKFYGTSNGYYSESADVIKIDNDKVPSATNR